MGIAHVIQRLVLAAMLLAFLGKPLASNAQTETGISCTPFEVPFTTLQAGWHWLSPDKLVFGVTAGLPAGGIYIDEVQWYQYYPSSATLEKLDANPFLVPTAVAEKLTGLENLQFGKDDIYAFIHESPNRKKFIYPRKVGSQTVYWFIDTNSDAEANLGRVKGRADVFWFPDQNHFIMQNDPNSVSPILLVTQYGKRVTTQRLADLPGLSTFGLAFRDSGFVVSGLNPSGRYILIQPESHEFWLYDLKMGQVTRLDFAAAGNRRAVWTSDSTFVLITSLGVMEYDIAKQQQRLLATRESLRLDPLSGDDSLSPDGRYLLFHHYANSVNTAAGELGICRLR